MLGLVDEGERVQPLRVEPFRCPNLTHTTSGGDLVAGQLRWGFGKEGVEGGGQCKISV